MITTHAFPIAGAIAVINAYAIDGQFVIEVACDDYDAYASLPAAVTFRHRQLGKTGWNSDRRMAYYKSGQRFALRFGPA